MFEPIQNLIKNTRLSPKTLNAAKVCFFAQKIIVKLLPETKGKFRIVSFNQGRLKVASSPILAYKIRMQEEEIKNKLQKRAKIEPFVITYLPQE